MEIAAFKDKSYILPVLTFDHSELNILSYKSPLDANLIFLDSWFKDLLSYRSSVEKELI
jgi:hypothetical protein